jgi:hypothetical protein
MFLISLTSYACYVWQWYDHFVAFGATGLSRCLIKVTKTIHIFTIPIRCIHNSLELFFLPSTLLCLQKV